MAGVQPFTPLSPSRPPLPPLSPSWPPLPRSSRLQMSRSTSMLEGSLFTPPLESSEPPLPPSSWPQNIWQPAEPQNTSEPESICEDLIHGSREDYFNICVPLFQASSRCNWGDAKIILERRPELVRFAITESYDTSLHVAASAEVTKLTEVFVKNLVNMMRKEDLKLQNNDSNTALCLAAAAGNVEVARILLKEDNNLLMIPGIQGMTPLYLGAVYGRENLVKYLYDLSRYLDRNTWTLEDRSKLLLKCMESDLFDVALELVIDNPELADDENILGVLARKPDAFNRVERNLFWRAIYSIFRILHMKVAPEEKDSNALKLLRFVWKHTITTMPKDKVLDILRGPPTDLADGRQQYSSRILFVAAKMGNTRFVVELLRTYPDLIRKVNDYNQTIFHIAIMHRHQDIHNLLYEIGSMKDLITAVKDKDGNNMLHLVGMTAMNMRPQMSGVSLVMQRELLWFKEVEKIVPPYYKKRKNNAGETPYELFSKNNQDLISQGLKWMRDCMVVATLIVTVAFAVAFTVPGGYNQDNGLPVFIHEKTFLVFVIADAISLFSSSTSLLVFLSILTSRYGQRDFLYSLPRKLMIGLVTLFISVAAMMVTFSASFFVLYHNGLKWVPILIATFAAMPVIGFAILQFPFLVDMFRSMYDSRYLFKPRKCML